MGTRTKWGESAEDTAPTLVGPREYPAEEDTIAIRPLPGYILSVEFADGSEHTLQLADRLDRGVFAALKDPELFNQVSMDDLGGAEWPNGASLSPEFLRWGPHLPHGCACGFEDPDGPEAGHDS